MSGSIYGQGAYGSLLYGYAAPDVPYLPGVAPVTTGFSGPGAPSTVTVSEPLGGPIYITTPRYTQRNLFPYGVMPKRKKSNRLRPLRLYPPGIR